MKGWKKGNLKTTKNKKKTQKFALLENKNPI